MGKKRKQREAESNGPEAAAAAKEDAASEERPKRTLLGWKEKPQENVDTAAAAPGFRNKEKVLVTCSRRINFRFESLLGSLLIFWGMGLVCSGNELFPSMGRYRHLMLNVVSLLPHCKKDNKVESKETKGATLNELVELRNCSSCLFFEVESHPSFDDECGFGKVDDLMHSLFLPLQCRKHLDLYLWMAKCPNGPSVKFLVNAGNFSL